MSRQQKLETPILPVELHNRHTPQCSRCCGFRIDSLTGAFVRLPTGIFDQMVDTLMKFLHPHMR